MTCKDCYHHKICRSATNEEFKECNQFKDKSKIIELPCKVGDRFYSIPSKKVCDFYKREGQPHRITVLEHTVRGFYIEKNHGKCEVDIQNMRGTFFYSVDFKEIWFLTREEAEKALKEKDND